jgi:hypothetical protein
LAREAHHFLLLLSHRVFEEFIGQQHDITATFSQWWQGDVHDGQPKVQIFTKGADTHRLLQVFIRGR